MPSINPIRTVTRTEREELAAQRLACNLLVKGCESALFNYGLAAEGSGQAEESRVERRAAEIAREVVGSWRATLDILYKLERKHEWPDMETLEGWLTSDQALGNNEFVASRPWLES